MRTLPLLAILCLSCAPHPPPRPTPAPPAPTTDAAPAPTRLRVLNGSAGPLWIFYQIGLGGGLLATPHQLQLAAGAHVDYPIPAAGLAATRFWAGSGCDATGNNCVVGQSGGPASQGFTCPAAGCAPPVDSKFEGTFGCLPSVPLAQCRPNPSSPTHDPLPRTDSWDTSMVDGFTMPFRVRVVGACPGGPAGGAIDCAAVAMGLCPTAEDLSTGGAFPALASSNLRVLTPQSVLVAGCYSDCGRLTFAQWGGLSYAPSAPQAQAYCCPTPPVTPGACRTGPVARTGYTGLVHRTCPQVYAYGYDDGTGLFSCPAGVRYEVTFYAPQ